MTETSVWVDVHNAFWVVMSIPLGFAGLVFVLPGLELVPGLALLAISGGLIMYVARLASGDRLAWTAGLAVHGLLVLAAPLYIPRWPELLAVPLAIASLYSVVVLLLNRGRWTGERRAEPVAA